MEWTRIRQPPGGTTSDIFHLEERQRILENERNIGVVPSKEKDECLNTNTGKSNLIPFKRAAEYAGITEKTRVRKPPGGDTHDIFGLEKRQKSNALKLNLEYLAFQKCVDSPIPEEKQPEIQSSPHSMDVSPSHHTCQEAKENIGLLSDSSDIIEGKGKDLSDEDNPKDKQSEDEADAKLLLPKKYLRHDTITGEVCEVEIPMRPKLRDCSNIAVIPDHEHDPKEMKPHRPSVRVRQPPGGASSIIF